MIYALLLLISIILQVAILGRFRIFSIMPNFVLIVLLLSVSHREKNKSFFIVSSRAEFLKNCLMILLYSLTAGLILDIFSGLSFGAITFSLSLSILLIYVFFRGPLNNFNLFYAFLLAFLATIFYYCWLWVFIRYQINYVFGAVIFKEAILNSILAFLFYAIQRFRKILY